MTTVVTVLRSGGCYDALDVQKLQEGIKPFLPGADLVCFSDVPVPCVRVPLRYGWPGWWSKMEIFDPHLRGDFLYFDLDTMFVKPLSDVAAVRGLTIMRDVYRPDGLQSSMMYVPQSEKAAIWESFRADPDGHMARCSTPDKWGDQGFLEEHWKDKVARWQDVCPGRVVSYKADVLPNNGVPDAASVVIFHGQPKPRDIGWTL